MRPVAEDDGHDAPGLIDEVVPVVAAVRDDVVVIAAPLLESQLYRPSGVASGSGTAKSPERCQPAWSSSSRACLPGLTMVLISTGCRFIAAVLQTGRTRAAPLPSLGQAAPKR